MDLDQQQSRLKLLIAKGKEQGYLTYSEVNDHLPEGIVDPEQIEDIISMINDMGIAVHEVPPDADALLLMGSTVNADDDETEEAAAALATIDSEFGRTTDPGAHVHARDGNGRPPHPRGARSRSPSASRRA